ncbi:MAG: N-acetyltransferase family protein [Colwellia sp.]|nr:N-acetyltransferase family protein [Colwellia sp.]
MIRVIQNKDLAAITDIYNYYISSTTATFEEENVTTLTMQGRVDKVHTANLPWLVAENESGIVVGYAYATKWRERFAYRFSVEVTVYLSPEHEKQGYGSLLYDALFTELKTRSVHTVIGGITLPNPASIALHEKFGMKQVAHFKEVGFKFDNWQDTGYWQGVL